MPKVRVLVVDDSAFARKVLRETLAVHPDIDVVGIARDGLEALECINELKPDVVTLDLVMPNLDGLGVLRALPAEGAPRVVVVSIADDESELAVAALQAGAFDLVHKPTALATDRLYELGDQLIATVLAAAGARALRGLSEPEPVTGPFAHKKSIVLVGTSTGGPQAITYLLKALPADFPVPIAIVVHMPLGYTDSFARRLNDECAIKVLEASDGLLLRPGLAVIARAGLHLKISRGTDGFRARLDAQPIDRLHMPSVDVLFDSLANGPAADVLGVVLTGMGEDGAQGAAAIVRAGGTIVVEAESSCVVYGMPRAVKDTGIPVVEAPLEHLARAITRNL